MSEPYSWPRMEIELFSPINLDIYVNRHKSPQSPTASHHHYHEAYELYYLYEGDRLYYIAGKTYRVARGNFVLIPPYENHSTGKSSPVGYDRFLLHFSREYIDGLIAKSGGSIADALRREERIFPIEFQKQGFVESLLTTMLTEYEERAPGFEQFLETAVTQLLLLIGRCGTNPGVNEQYDADTVHRTISEAVAYINLHYAEPLSLHDMAAHFFVSPGYFSHAFKRITGLPFVKYVNGVRIKEAQRLLRSRDITIAATAEAVGYGGTTHFGRVFKEITGVTPMEYKMRGN